MENFPLVKKAPGLSPTLYEVQVRAFKTAGAHGFWNYEEASTYESTLNIVLSKLALVHSEVSEAVEELRKSTDLTPYYRAADGKPEGVGAELADIVIRVGDLATALGIDLGAAVLEKMDFNDTRPHMHGKLA